MTTHSGKNPLSAPLLVGRPNIGNEAAFRQRVDTLLATRWLTNNGPLVQELEQRLADYLGVKHCLAMANGTVALELAIRACDLQGEVILPSMTFVATAHALQWQGITPVFADIDPASLNLCPRSVEQLVTPRTSGILGVHLYGRGCDIDGLQDVAERHGLTLLFDAAHAFGSAHKGRMIGNFGACEAFSFHATKVFNTFEGGAVTTNNDALAAKLRLMRNFGFEGEDCVSYIGTNGKMAEINAAMGLVNLDSLPDFIAVNRANYLAYQQALAGVPGVVLLPYDSGQAHNYQYVILRIEQQRYGKSRDALKQELERHQVFARRYFFPGCHRMEPYRTLYPGAGQALPQTEAFSEQVLALPTGTQTSPAEIAGIGSIIRAFAAP